MMPGTVVFDPISTLSDSSQNAIHQHPIRKSKTLGALLPLCVHEIFDTLNFGGGHICMTCFLLQLVFVQCPQLKLLHILFTEIWTSSSGPLSPGVPSGVVLRKQTIGHHMIASMTMCTVLGILLHCSSTQY